TKQPTNKQETARGRPSGREGRRPRTPGRPVEKLHRVDDGEGRRARNLREAADVAGGDEIRRNAVEVCDLAVAQPGRQLGLKEIVSPGRAAAQMPLRRV